MTDAATSAAPSAAAHALASRGLHTATLAERRPHGDRVKYIAGCRCALCREANTLYENARRQARARGEWNGLVPVTDVQAHMEKLRAAGIGRRTISQATGVAETVLQEIIAGRKQRIRAVTSRRVLAMSTEARADGSLVPATRTWRLLDDLCRQGFTRAELALQLGHKRGALQISRQRVHAITELQVERLHAKLDGTLRPARQTRAQIHQLLDEGFDFAGIAERLGITAADLDAAVNGRPQHVATAFADNLDRLYRRLMS